MRWSFVAILVCSALLGAQSPAATIVDHLLVIEQTGRSGRSAIWRDPIALQLVRGTWHPPTAGDTLTDAEGHRQTWRRIDATGGVFRDRALRGGHALAIVEAPRDEIRILAARGHRHVWVRGIPRGGDVYNLGCTRLPVQLHAGANQLLFKGGRGSLQVELTAPRAPIYLERRDATTPDLVPGTGTTVAAGIMLTNATTAPLDHLTVGAAFAGSETVLSPVSGVPPLACRKVPVALPVPRELTGDKVTYHLALRGGDGATIDELELELAVRPAGAKHKRTFVSDVDGSVQYYAVTPAHPVDGDTTPPALFLSLHGASVEATNQAYAYDHKKWGHVVAPTNRRPYGFDWEDWGRLDALEVLADAMRVFGPDPRRIYLTGHSMGGHGTWNLGAHFPDRFAAIAPSAGWRDFWSYGQPRPQDKPRPVEAMLDRAANGSRTLLLEHNYRHHGIYVLHGDADDNVPVSQARFMRERLGTFHRNFAYYERAGAGHWWGNQCVDWPPLFSFLHDNVRPAPLSIRRVDFTTVHPAISARCDWASIECQRHWCQPSTIALQLDVDGRRVGGDTANVEQLVLDLGRFAGAGGLAADAPVVVALDGDEVEVPWPASGQFRLRRHADGWQIADRVDPRRKGPRRAGPFKQAFRNHMVMVYGTAGSEEENSWSLAKARYDAETFWYRGNGSVDIVADQDFDVTVAPDRNVILYGNQDSNSAWRAVLPNPPIHVRRRAITLGDRTLEADDLACLFVYPRSGSDVASVAVVSGTGIAGLRLTDNAPYFVSGAGFPDWLVFATDMLAEGAAGVRGAGFFDSDWQLGDSAW